MIDRTHDKSLRSWVESANQYGTDFPVQNLPFCLFRTEDNDEPRVGIGIGDWIVDARRAFGIGSMDRVMAMRRSERVALRRAISDFLVKRKPGAESFLTPMSYAELLLPYAIGNYTDFYSSI